MGLAMGMEFREIREQPRPSRTQGRAAHFRTLIGAENRR